MPENTPAPARLPDPRAPMTPAERSAYNRLIARLRWSRHAAAKAEAAAARLEEVRAEFAEARAAAAREGAA